jgi:PAS domain S-box-containing protein
MTQQIARTPDSEATRKHATKERKIREGEGEEDAEAEEEEEVDDGVTPTEFMCDILTALGPFFVFLVVLPPVVWASVGLDTLLTHYWEIMSTLPRADCAKAAERIYLDSTGRHHDEPVGRSSAGFLHKAWMITCLSAFVISAFLVLFAIRVKTTVPDLTNLKQQFIIFLYLRNQIFEASRYATWAIILTRLSRDGDFGLSYADPAEMARRALVALEVVDKVYVASVTGFGDFGSSIGLSPELDELRFSSRCASPESLSSPSESYACVSFERVFQYWEQLIKKLALDYESSDPIESNLPALWNVQNTRLSCDMEDIMEHLATEYHKSIDSVDIFAVVVIIVCVLVAVLCNIIELVVVSSISNVMRTFKAVLLRVDPIAFVSHPPMLGLVYQTGHKKRKTVRSAAEAVFETAADGMVAVNFDGIVEFLNGSTTAIFGFSPEQVLGQHIRLLLPPTGEGNAPVYGQMELMKTGQASFVYEAPATGYRDNGSQVPLHLTLLGFSSKGRRAEHFALVLKDQSDELQRKRAVENAKQESEKLLLQILPRSIMMRLNRGDKNISFTVNSSTVIFIDIEKFSDYTADLQPREIMQNLGMVFTSYDNLLSHYNLITKIKLIGDDYMAAAGLFLTEDQSEAHAHQVIDFGLGCLAAIEHVNSELKSSLEVRIGVNTDGPLIAGVLGTEKPLFDIIGDPINVAARLQSTCIPGHVQISLKTYELVKQGNYHIEQRGEIELKGKGKQMTYLVHRKPTTPEDD